jgi:ATP-dependent exoDNAse (exonuclease V) beta subunit
VRALRSGPFGPGQVVLVRDDSTKEKVLSENGEVALVLTILESKGMEFDDVLLLDFFSGSECPSSFRKLNDYYTTGYLEEAIGSNAVSHALLCCLR